MLALGDVADDAAVKHFLVDRPGRKGQFDGNFMSVLMQPAQLHRMPDNMVIATLGYTFNTLPVWLAVFFRNDDIE